MTDLIDVVKAHTEMLTLHYNALAAHCECLGMNAENMAAAMLNEQAVFNNGDYIAVMCKWGLNEMKKGYEDEE